MLQLKSDILSFDGENRFYSNFYPVYVTLNGFGYPSVENAYQAAKTLVFEERWKFQLCSASMAKRWGRKLNKRADWDDVKLQVMEELLRQKFAPGSQLAALLISTGTCPIVEGNTWGDTFWGVCDGVGENHLGRIIMKIRGELCQSIL